MSNYSKHWETIPKVGLQLGIIKQAIGKKKTEDLIKKYMLIKKRNYLIKLGYPPICICKKCLKSLTPPKGLKGKQL